MAPRGGFERLLRLAAYVGEHPSRGCTLTDIAGNVPGYGHLTQSALARGLRRDLDDLAENTGIVVEWSDQAQRYFIRPPLFTAKERQALISAAGVVDVEGVGVGRPFGEIGAAVDADVAQVVVRVHHLVVVLRDAIAARRSVEFRYQGVDGAAGSRRVDPYAVGLWRNRWYFVGFDHDRSERRVFRLDRILTDGNGPGIAAVGDPNAFDVPPGAELEAALTMDPNRWGTDPPVMARVRVAHDSVPAFLAEFSGTVEQQEASSATITVEVRDYESFVIRILGFGAGADLLGPTELRGLVREWLDGQVSA